MEKVIPVVLLKPKVICILISKASCTGRLTGAECHFHNVASLCLILSNVLFSRHFIFDILAFLVI